MKNAWQEKFWKCLKLYLQILKLFKSFASFITFLWELRIKYSRNWVIWWFQYPYFLGTEAYSESCQISNMKRFANIGLIAVHYFLKALYLNVCHGSESTSSQTLQFKSYKIAVRSAITNCTFTLCHALLVDETCPSIKTTDITRMFSLKNN